MRLAATAFSVILFGGMMVLALWHGSIWALNEWVYQNPTFNIRRIEIETDGVIPVGLLRAWAGIKEGENLWSVDLFRARRDLELQPLIQSASVERVLPNTLRLRVVEREPVAQITGFQSAGSNELKAVIYHLDREGYVMVPLAFEERNARVASDPLPLLTGIMGTELRPGKQVESPQMHAALRLLVAFGNSPMSGMMDVKMINLASPQVLLLTTTFGNEITFPLEGPERQLRRWHSVHDYATRERKAIATLDLSVSNNVPARWQEVSQTIPIRPKPQKSSRYRKKHV